MSEFSIQSAEGDILPDENVLDLRLSEVQYENKLLNSVLGMSEDLPN